MNFIEINTPNKNVERNSLENQILQNKMISRIINRAKKDIFTGKCICCGNTVDSFCNSHNVPAFCLNHISEKGMLGWSNTIYQLPGLKQDQGINQAGTFHLICRHCDSTMFQAYENVSAYNQDPPSSKVIAQIALKNYLKLLYKRYLEMGIYKRLEMLFPDNIPLYDYKKRITQIDIDQYSQIFPKIKKTSFYDSNDEYFIHYYRLLNYVTPLAFQCPINLAVDLEGNIVNHIYDLSGKYHNKFIHVCVFPLENQTAVIVFTENHDKRYRNFFKQFNQLSAEEKLGVINYMILLNSEDYFFSPTIQQIMGSKEISKIVALTSDYTRTANENPYNGLREKFDLSNWKCIPNLLSEENKLR